MLACKEIEERRGNFKLLHNRSFKRIWSSTKPDIGNGIENTHCWVRITVQMASFWTWLDSTALLHTNNNLFSSNLINEETSYTVILPPTVSVLFPVQRSYLRAVGVPRSHFLFSTCSNRYTFTSSILFDLNWIRMMILAID